MLKEKKTVMKNVYGEMRNFNLRMICLHLEATKIQYENMYNLTLHTRGGKKKNDLKQIQIYI